MGFKVYAFAFALVRWVALVALALVPTIIVVVAYRKFKGQPLWSLKDVPVAAEVTLCIAWLSLLAMSYETFRSGMLASDLTAAVAAACFAAIPVVCGYESIAALRRVVGLREPISQPSA
jgi:dolichyl-phosphate-mannose--protein O-mannosyl transferase